MVDFGKCTDIANFVLLAVHILTFAIVLYKSIVIIIKHEAIRDDFMVMILYISINCELLFASISASIELSGNFFFPIEFTENMFAYLSQCIIPVRILSLLGKLEFNEKVKSALIYFCWLIFLSRVVGVIIFTITSSEKFANIFFLSANTIILYNWLLIYLLYNIWVYKKLRICMIRIDKILTAFFIIQMLGYVSVITYNWMSTFKHSIYENKCYDGIATIAKNSLVELIPNALIIIYVSNSAESQSPEYTNGREDSFISN